jgi:hypothetical protein
MDQAGANVCWKYEGLTDAILDGEDLGGKANRDVLFV